jgi:hypothetical protein
MFKGLVKFFKNPFKFSQEVQKPEIFVPKKQVDVGKVIIQAVLENGTIGYTRYCGEQRMSPYSHSREITYYVKDAADIADIQFEKFNFIPLHLNELAAPITNVNVSSIVQWSVIKRLPYMEDDKNFV